MSAPKGKPKPQTSLAKRRRRFDQLVRGWQAESAAKVSASEQRHDDPELQAAFEEWQASEHTDVWAVIKALGCVPMPAWLKIAIRQMLERQVLDESFVQTWSPDRIHRLRHLKVQQYIEAGGRWEDVFSDISADLGGGMAEGAPSSIKASYQRIQRRQRQVEGR